MDAEAARPGVTFFGTDDDIRHARAGAGQRMLDVPGKPGK